MEGIVRGRRAEIAFSIAPCAKLDFRQVTKGSSDFIKRARGGPICLEKLSVCLHFFIPFPRMCQKKKKKEVYAFDGEKQKHLRYFSFFFFCLFVVFLRFTDLRVEKYCEKLKCRVNWCLVKLLQELKKKKGIFLIEILHVPPLLRDAFNLNQHG